jgi:hypothetical protein
MCLTLRSTCFTSSRTRNHSFLFGQCRPTLDDVGDFRAFPGKEFDHAPSYATLRKVESVGRQIESKEWLLDVKAKTGSTLLP